MSSKPPWDPALSDGCSVPSALRRKIPALAEMCLFLLPECLAHDEAFFYGGSVQDFHDTNNVFYEGIRVKLIERYGQPRGEAWATEWHGIVNTIGWSHWNSGRSWDGRVFWQAAGTEAP